MGKEGAILFRALRLPSLLFATSLKVSPMLAPLELQQISLLSSGFTVAGKDSRSRDLTKMQFRAQIDQAVVSPVREGQKA